MAKAGMLRGSDSALMAGLLVRESPLARPVLFPEATREDPQEGPLWVGLETPPERRRARAPQRVPRERVIQGTV
jgi:hypothetical protein